MASLLVNSYVAIFIRSVINSEQGAAIYSCVTLSHQSINIYKYAMYIYICATAQWPNTMLISNKLPHSPAQHRKTYLCSLYHQWMC